MIERLSFLSRHLTIVRYLVAGGTAAAVNLLALYVFTEYIGLHYLISAMAAFIIALTVSFLLQKFWTFQDTRTDKVHTQASLYAAIAISNFFLNLVLIYFFVEILHVWYLLAQVIIGGGIAFYSFLMYRHFIFTKKETPFV